MIHLSTYFDHAYASNSDLKKLWQMVHGSQIPEVDNLEEIFDLGSLIHAILLEPHRVDRINYTLREFDELKQFTKEDFDIADRMSKTFMRDELCRKFMMMHDFKREHEFYRHAVMGIKGRCKMDGWSKSMSAILEYKGLSITTYNGFVDAVDRFDYDQGAAWYLTVSESKFCLIAAPSKKNPDRFFKELVTRDHLFYKRGIIKAERCVNLWKDTFGSEVSHTLESPTVIEPSNILPTTTEASAESPMGRSTSATSLGNVGVPSIPGEASSR